MRSMSNGLAPPVNSPLGEVSTERLRLRAFDGRDLDDLSEVFSKREVWQFPYGRGLSREETSHFLDLQIKDWGDYGFGCWLATLSDTGRVIGYVGLSVPHFLPEILPAVEVGWRFDPEVWGQGFASEGATAALTEGFTTLGLTEICSLPQSVNPQSFRVCERLGMVFRRNIMCPPTEGRGAVEARMYALTRDEWRQRL